MEWKSLTHNEGHSPRPEVSERMVAPWVPVTVKKQNNKPSGVLWPQFCWWTTSSPKEETRPDSALPQLLPFVLWVIHWVNLGGHGQPWYQMTLLEQEGGSVKMEHSPYTAMVLVSCRMAFPAETCTVMVFIPSEVNLNDMLPSKVIKG